MGLFDGKKGGSLTAKGEGDFIGDKLDTIFFPDTSKDEEAAAKARKAAFDEIARLQLPELEKLKLQDAVWQGDLTPEMLADPEAVQASLASLERVDSTAMDGVTTDPRLKEQQLSSLSALSELANSGGMTSADKANLARIESQVGQADRGRRDAIMQNAQTRGMGGSGMELLAQLSSSQAATDRSAQQGLDVAGMAQQRALDAMMQGGQLAGNVRGQDFSEASRIAEAKDAISKFNAQNANQHSQFNAGVNNQTNQFNSGQKFDAAKINNQSTNQAAQYNHAGKQGISDTNTQNAHSAAKFNSNLPQQNFDNQAALAGMKSNAHSGNSTFYQGQVDKEQDQAAASRGTAISTAGAAMSDKRAKKGVKSADDMDLDSFLACLQPKSFKYKDEKHGKGDFVGVLAQDLNNSKLGRDTLVEVEEGKMGFDKDKMQGLMLAAIKRLSDKIDKAS